MPEDLVISVLPDRTVFIEDDEVPLAELDARLAGIGKDSPLTRIILRGDQNATYGVIMDILTRCNRNGLMNIALASRD